jgi:DNA-binding response OmpR family regulator
MNQKVLVVTSDLDLAMALDVEIKNDGGLVRVCGGKTSKDEMAKWQPDVLIIDGTLLGKEGLKVCHSLKRSKQFGSIPIIILNNLITPRLMSAAYKAGADFYVLSQGEDRRALLITLRSLFGMQTQQANAA